MIRIDGIKQHLKDANETLFFQRQLEEVEAKLYEFKKKELKYRMYIPVSNRDNPGANTITYRMFNKVGMAKVIANYASDLPRADVYGQEFSQTVKSIASSFGYSQQELRAAQMANTPLENMKADAVRRAIREKESGIAWNGDSEHNLSGFLTNTNIPTVAAANGADPVSPLWVNKTADEMLTDISTLVTTVRTQSSGIHEADTLLLPIAQYNLLAQTPRSSMSDVTLLNYIKDPKNAYGITTIDWLPSELDSAFTSETEDGMIAYERTNEVLEQRIPMEMMTYPMQARNLEFVVPVEARHGGVVIRYPLGICIMTGI